MLDAITENLAAFQFIWAAILAPIIGWFGYLIRSFARQRRKTNRIVQILSGLPEDAKEVLIYFHKTGQHTVVAPGGDRVAELLFHQGILVRGPSASAFHAANQYVTLQPDYWLALPKWIRKDPIAHHLLLREDEPNDD